ncbi:MAG: hypothetical protein P8Y58_05595, partial [Novosphingobium sp.]
VYALGVILHELLTGEIEFFTGDHASTIARVLNHEVSSVLRRRPDAPPRLDRIIARSLAKDWEKRYDSALDFANDLRSMLVQSESARTPGQRDERQEDGSAERVERSPPVCQRAGEEIELLRHVEEALCRQMFGRIRPEQTESLRQQKARAGKEPVQQGARQVRYTFIAGGQLATADKDAQHCPAGEVADPRQASDRAERQPAAARECRARLPH